MSRVAAALLAWAGAVAAQQDAQQVEAQVRELVEAGRERLWAGGQAAAARERFAAALALPGTWSTPFAEIGLATLARLEGNLPEALDRLAKVRRRTAAWPMDQELPRLVRFDLHIEAGLCHLAMGLLDRAGAEFAAAADYAGARGSPRMVALDLARVDLALAANEVRPARRALANLHEALGGITGDSAAGTVQAHQLAEVRLRELLLRKRVARRAEDYAQVAAELAEQFSSLSEGSSHRTRIGCDAAAAFALSGDLEAALSISKQLCRPPFESLQREAEIKATHLGLLLRVGGERAELEAAHIELQRLANELFAVWRAMPPRSGGVGTFHYQSRREVLGTLLMADRALAPDRPDLALAHLEAALSLGTLSRRLHPEPIALEALEWPAETGALVFVFAPGAAHLLAVDRTGIEHFTVSLDADDEDRLAELVRCIERPPMADAARERRVADALAETLADRLLPTALGSRLRSWKNLLLVGEERSIAALQALPLDGVALGVGKAVCHLPSLSMLVALQQRAAARPITEEATDLVLFADPALDPAVAATWEVEELHLRPEQLDSLSSGWGADHVRLLVREQATAAALRDRGLASARQLTIVAHGVEDLRAERSAAIAVAGGDASGLLRAEVVESLLAPPWVVLAVCGAAGGPGRLGDDGVHHLGGAFVLAGADRVVLAGGQLAVGATIDLVSEVTRGVAGGVGPAEALRAARAKVHATPGREHPYYWAGLRLLGLPDAVPGKPKR